jgi:hypothetical protein
MKTEGYYLCDRCGHPVPEAKVQQGEDGEDWCKTCLDRFTGRRKCYPLGSRLKMDPRILAALQANVDRMLGSQCDGRFTRTRAWLSDHVPSSHIPAILEWLEMKGAACDCEVRVNLPAPWEVGA